METSPTARHVTWGFYGPRQWEIGSLPPRDPAVLTTLQQRSRSAPEDAVTPHPLPITVTISFQLCPNRGDDWRRTWHELARIAQRLPTCHRFDLLQERDDVTRCLAISSWNDRAAFNRFVRHTNLLWLDRALGYLRCPAQYSVFDGISGDAVRPDVRTVAAEA